MKVRRYSLKITATWKIIPNGLKAVAGKVSYILWKDFHIIKYELLF